MEQGLPPESLYYSTMLWLMEESFYFPLINKGQGDIGRIDDIDEFFNFLEIFHCISVLRYSCKALIRNQLIAKEHKTPQLQEVLKRLETSPNLQSIPLLRVYQLCIQLFQAFDSATYEEFKTLALGEMLKYPKMEKDFLFSLLNNHTAQAVKTDIKHVEDSFEIYTFGMNEGLLENNGILNSVHFISYITTACSLGITKIAKRFLKEKQNKLHQSEKKQVIRICKSRILLAEQQYKQAFDFLKKGRFQEIQLRLVARVTRLMVCYDWYTKGKENMEFEGDLIFVDDELRSFMKSLSLVREGVSQEFIQAFDNFLEMLKAILTEGNQITTDKTKEDLKENLQRYDTIVARGWLVEKIGEL